MVLFAQTFARFASHLAMAFCAVVEILRSCEDPAHRRRCFCLQAGRLGDGRNPSPGAASVDAGGDYGRVSGIISWQILRGSWSCLSLFFRCPCSTGMHMPCQFSCMVHIMVIGPSASLLVVMLLIAILLC